ncbi:MAG: DUF3791 domain-containing protein [Muribaculaceae bacterium]
MQDKVKYVVALIAEFASHHQLSDAQAFRYLRNFGAIDLCDEFYQTMHTLSFNDNVENLTIFCRNKGGEL